MRRQGFSPGQDGGTRGPGVELAGSNGRPAAPLAGGAKMTPLVDPEDEGGGEVMESRG